MGIFGGDGEKRRKREAEERRLEEERRQREEAEAERQREAEELEREREEEAKAKEAERQAQEEARQKALEEMASDTESFAQEFGKPQEPQAQSTQQSQRDRQVQETVGEANRAIDRGLGRGQSTAQNAAQRTRQGLQGATLPQSQATQGQASSVLADAAAPNRATPRPATFAPSQLGSGSGAGPVRGGMGGMQTAATARPPTGTPQNAPGAPGQNQMAQGQEQSSQTPAAPPTAPTVPRENQNVVQMQRELSGQEQRTADRALGQVDRAFGNRVGDALGGIQAQYNQNRMLLDEPNGQAPTPSTPIGQDTPENQVRRTENMGLYDPWAGTGQEIEQGAEQRALAELAGDNVPSVDIGEIAVTPNARTQTPMDQSLERRVQDAQEAIRGGVEQPRVYDAEGNLIQGQAPTPAEAQAPTPRQSNPVVQQAVAEGRVDPTVAPEVDARVSEIEAEIQRDLEAGNITEEQAADMRSALNDGLTGQGSAAAEGAEDEAPEVTPEQVQQLENPEVDEELREDLRSVMDNPDNDEELRQIEMGLAAYRIANDNMARALENQMMDNVPATFEEEVANVRNKQEKARRLRMIGMIVGAFLVAFGSEDVAGLGVLLMRVTKGISEMNTEAADTEMQSLNQERDALRQAEQSDLQRYQAIANARGAELDQLNRMRGQRQTDERLRIQDERNQQRYELDQRRLEEDRALDNPDSELSEIERRNLSVINGTLVQRGFRGLSPEEIEMMSGRAARSTRVQLERVLGNRNVRGGGLGTGGGPTGSTAITREDVSQNDDQMIASARRFGVRPILDSRGKLNRQATEALIREQQELGNNGDGTWTLNGSYNLRSNQPRDASVRRRQIENVNNIVSQHRAGMETLREMERLGRELGLDSEDVIDRIAAMGEGYLTNEFAGLTERMMGIVSQIKNIGVINPSEAPAVEQALPSPINWRNITSAEQFNRAVGQWRRALQINTRSQLFGNEVMDEDVNRFTSNTSMSSQGSNQRSNRTTSSPQTQRRNPQEMSNEELERRREELLRNRGR